MRKVAQKTGTMVKAATEVMTQAKTLAVEWLANELNRKEHSSQASQYDKKAKELKGKMKKLFSENDIDEKVVFDRQHKGKRYSMTLGDMEAARSTTVIDHDAIWKDYKNGDISEVDMKAMFKGVSKTAIDKTLGDSVAIEYFTTTKPTAFNIKIG